MKKQAWECLSQMFHRLLGLAAGFLKKLFSIKKGLMDRMKIHEEEVVV